MAFVPFKKKTGKKKTAKKGNPFAQKPTKGGKKTAKKKTRRRR